MDSFELAKQFFAGGLQLLQGDNLEGAEAQFARSLEILPDRVSTLNNLAGVKIRLEKFTEAEAFARKAITLDEKSPEAWSSLGIALAKMSRHEEALRAYAQALKFNPTLARVWHNKAMTLLELKRHDEALLACDKELELDPNQHEVLHLQSRVLKELKRPDESRKAYLKSFAMRVVASPVFVSSRRATQKADALIISPDPCLDDGLKSFEALHRECPNFPGQLSQMLQDDFRFSFVFKGDAASRPAREQIPQPDFVINNCANGERIVADGDLPSLAELADSFGVPVVNHPVKVVKTGREGTAHLLENVAGVRVPRTLRFFPAGKTTEQLAQEIEAQFGYPLITRTLASQRGVGMNKSDTRAELVNTLSADKQEEFLVTEFVDSRQGDDLHRKIRASIVGDEIVIVRVDYHPSWKVHGGRRGRRVSFYLENPHLLDQEKRICAAPERELGQTAMQSLRAIRARIPLDVFGVDFDVDRDGAVIFYEANATMNLLSNAQKEVSNPKEADDRLKMAFRHYLASLVGHGRGVDS